MQPRRYRPPEFTRLGCLVLVLGVPAAIALAVALKSGALVIFLPAVVGAAGMWHGLRKDERWFRTTWTIVAFVGFAGVCFFVFFLLALAGD